MALPNQYLTSQKNLSAVFEAIRAAKAPEKFTVKFLEGLGFKSNADRLVIGILKALKFLDESGKPQNRYFEFLDDTRWERVLGEAIEESYGDLFQVNRKAYEMSKTQVKNKIKTLSQGAYSESVLDKMGMTFTALAKLGDFTSDADKNTKETGAETETPAPAVVELLQNSFDANSDTTRNTSLGGLHYNIQIILPESRDPKVYDVLFKSLKDHLIE